MKVTCTKENLNQGLMVTGHLANKNVNLPILNNIKCKNNNTRIKGIVSEDFPVIPEIEKNNPIKINIKDLKNAISQVIFSVSNNETRPEISGVFMNFNGQPGNLTLVGTDSYRLAEKTLKIESNGEQKAVIAPVKTLQEVLRILGLIKDGAESAETMDIYLSENQILFSINGIEIISRLVEGHYPDYKQIIPVESKTNAIVSTSELVKVIKTTALFSKIGIFDINLEFLPANNSIVISSNNIQVGESVSEVESVMTGEKNNTTLNYRFILDGLNSVDASEVEISLIDNNIPCLIRPKDDKSYLYIIMPIKQ